MIIKSFRGEGIHGFLDLEINFNNDLTFVVGINGTGKTTALNAIDALINPSFLSLARLDFRAVRVEFINDDKSIGYIAARKEENYVIVTTSGSQEPLNYPIYVSDNERPPYREQDHEIEYYRDFVSKNAKHEVILFIESLPTPMFLGLNRRSGSFTPRRMTPRMMEGRQIRNRENIFGGPLTEGVAEAIEIAEYHYRDTLIEVSRLGEKLRRSMVMELVNVRRPDGLSLSFPSEAELKLIPQMRKGLEPLAGILGIPHEGIQETFGAFLDKLEATAKLIPKAKKLQDVQHFPKDQKILDAMFSWSLNVPELERIKALSKMVEDNNKLKKALTEKSERYLDVLERFLDDSGKKIEFSEKGYILITLKQDGIKIPISSFSSGEAQIFVILTHLFFNPRAERNNVFIIDEPELSLHVQWQELFVESVIKANPNVQYIMATHSPSIILDRIDQCQDVISKVNRIQV